MPLPLGCDESSLSHMEKSTRITYLFFLAETSLREILARIFSISSSESMLPLDAQSSRMTMSPIISELKSQLSIWKTGVPQSLEWLPEPSGNVRSPLHVRLKLLYWLAQFRLMQPSVNQVVRNAHAEFNIDVWTTLMHGLSSGYTLIRVLNWEVTHLDLIMGKR